MITKPKPLPALHELTKLYRYEPTSGKLYWRNKRGGRRNPDNEAGGKSGNSYMLAYVNGKQHYVHRICWKLFHATEPPDQIDHVEQPSQ
jgi:hypothetical protein